MHSVGWDGGKADLINQGFQALSQGGPMLTSGILEAKPQILFRCK